MTTTVNGEHAEWTSDVWRLWHTRAIGIDPKTTDARVVTADYRPAVEDRAAEFSYTLTSGQRCWVRWQPR